jgi:hypothetical protein
MNTISAVISGLSSALGSLPARTEEIGFDNLRFSFTDGEIGLPRDSLRS